MACPAMVDHLTELARNKAQRPAVRLYTCYPYAFVGMITAIDAVDCEGVVYLLENNGGHTVVSAVDLDSIIAVQEFAEKIPASL